MLGVQMDRAVGNAHRCPIGVSDQKIHPQIPDGSKQNGGTSASVFNHITPSPFLIKILDMIKSFLS
jgi:hypothetical protein